jgi:RNA polymerase sigma factor (sigma-70 family)
MPKKAAIPRTPSPPSRLWRCRLKKPRRNEKKSVRFRDFLRIPFGESAIMDANDELIPTRQSLLSRIRDWNDQPSWQDFFNTYWKLIYNTARRAGLNHAECEEVAQETLITISRSIRDFHYDRKQGAFKSWLRTTAAWKIHDRLRRQREEQTDSVDEDGNWLEVDDVIDPASDPITITSNWESDWEQSLADAAIERVKRKLPPKHYQVFDLAVMKQWPTKKIAKTFGMNVGYVYLIKHRVSARLKAELRKLRRDPCLANYLVGSP